MEFGMETRNEDNLLREVVGDDANDAKRKQKLEESDLDTHKCPEPEWL